MAIDDNSNFVLDGFYEFFRASLEVVAPLKNTIGYRVLNVAISIFGIIGLSGIGMSLKAGTSLIVTRAVMLFSSQGFLILESAAALAALKTALLVTGGGFLLFAIAVHIKYRLYPEFADSPKKSKV